jgi:hypothetical protein
VILNGKRATWIEARSASKGGHALPLLALRATDPAIQGSRYDLDHSRNLD